MNIGAHFIVKVVFQEQARELAQHQLPQALVCEGVGLDDEQLP
jgi:hypothetical protein